MRHPLLLAALAAVPMLVPASASGETWAHRDPSHDVSVTRFVTEPEPCGTQTSLDGTRDTHVDITRLAVAHVRDAVIVRVRFRDLLRRPSHGTMVTIRTSERTFEAHAFRMPREDEVETELFRAPNWNSLEPGECGDYAIARSPLPCLRLVGKVFASRDLVRIAIPRGCLKEPRWVRVGAQSYGFIGEYPDFKVRSDFWAPRGLETPGLDLPLGPRVLRSR